VAWYDGEILDIQSEAVQIRFVLVHWESPLEVWCPATNMVAEGIPIRSPSHGIFRLRPNFTDPNTDFFAGSVVCCSCNNNSNALADAVVKTVFRQKGSRAVQLRIIYLADSATERVPHSVVRYKLPYDLQLDDSGYGVFVASETPKMLHPNLEIVEGFGEGDYGVSESQFYGHSNPQSAAPTGSGGDHELSHEGA